MIRHALSAVVLGALLLAAAPLHAQRFHASDPVARDLDDLHVPRRPAATDAAAVWDALTSTLRAKPKVERVPAARGVNTLGEVPDSTWFENRLGVRPMSTDELVRGPNGGDGPDLARPWTVVRGEWNGVAGTLSIRDARGDVYGVRFDPRENFGLATGAELIGTRLFHAFGYHVPQTWIVYVPRAQFRVGPRSTFQRPYARARGMAEADLDALLAERAALPDGRLRVAVSRALPGESIGPRQFHGTRPDDPNDVIPHEDRRDQRGYRVLCAWTNHDEARGFATLDAWVSENGRRFVRHYLHDFSSILGCGADHRGQLMPHDARRGHEYALDLAPMLKTALTLGFWKRPWHSIRDEFHPSVGAIEAEHFDPERWVPSYPNPAFLSMLPEDAFWAARIVSKFSDEALRALVAAADLRAPAAEEQLVRALIGRRDKISARYFSGLNPLADFRVEARDGRHALAFTNYGEERRLATVEAYEYQWFSFDNRSGATEPLGAPALAVTRALPLPPEATEYVMVRIRTLAPGRPAWNQKVDVFVRTGDEPRIVGVERES